MAIHRRLNFSIAIGAFFLLTLATSFKAFASGHEYFSSDFFKGIDTVYVIQSAGTNSKLMPWPSRTDLLAPFPSFLAVEEAYAQNPLIRVISSRHTGVDIYDDRTVRFWFTVSAQPAVVDGKNIVIASVGLQVNKLKGGPDSILFFNKNVTYPFIVPDNTADFDKKLAEAARFLAEPLLPFLPCPENKEGKKCPRPDVPPYGESAPSMRSPKYPTAQ